MVQDAQASGRYFYYRLPKKYQLFRPVLNLCRAPFFSVIVAVGPLVILSACERKARHHPPSIVFPPITDSELFSILAVTHAVGLKGRAGGAQMKLGHPQWTKNKGYPLQLLYIRRPETAPRPRIASLSVFGL